MLTPAVKDYTPAAQRKREKALRKQQTEEQATEEQALAEARKTGEVRAQRAARS